MPIIVSLYSRFPSMTTAPSVSMCNICHRVAGEFILEHVCTISGANITCHSYRTWPAIWELGDNWPNGVGFMRQTK